jgi:DNA invertase Pin-like site-specific DNA recombinase
MIVARVHAGLARAKAQGKKLGRPSALTIAKEAEAREMLGEGMGVVKIARALGVGTGTISNIKAQLASTITHIM